jgi:ATP-binding cassette subfamily B protein
MPSLKRLQKTFLLQQDQYDCGVVCLRNILGYYQANISLEKLREWSGTGLQGTTLLGLFQAANQVGFNARGVQADNIATLQQVEHPCILHVVTNDKALHYVVYYPGKRTDRFLIGDPAKGLIYLDKATLEKIWQSKMLLLLEPCEKLAQWQQENTKKIHWLWQTIRKDVNLLYIAIGLGTVAAALGLSTAIFSQKLVDTILPSRDFDKLFVGLLVLGLLLILKSVFSWLRQSLLMRQAYHFNMRLTGGFYQSILHLGKPFFDNRKTGDLIARLNDTIRIQQAISYILGEMAIQFLMLLASLILLFIFSWPIGLFCLAIVPTIYGVVKYFERDIIAQQRAVMIAHAQNESNYVDSLRGIHTIKVMNKEKLFVSAARMIFSVFQDAIWQLGKTRIRFNAVLEITTMLFLLAVTAWSAIEVLNGSLKIGGLVAILQLSGLLMQTAVNVALTNLQVQEARVAMDRMYEFTTTEPEYKVDGVDKKPLPVPLHFEKLTIEKMAFRFPGKKLLLKDISIEIKRGEIIALTGESGQGKSTLLQVLQKFYTYEEGKIVLNNQYRLENIDTVVWRKLIGVVPQDIVMFSGTVLANICLDTNEQAIEQVEQFCQDYGFAPFFQSYPQGYNTILGEGGVALSGGQKQLLALARCLYSSPKLVLLDEPTAAMDANTEQFVIDLLKHISKKAALLIISHKDALTRIANRVYYLKEGVATRLSQHENGLQALPTNALE